jgi:hypothetical protein
MLKQAVLAYAAPKHRQHSGTPKGLGHAFCEYVTRYPLDRLPQAGGVDATVVVTMTLENLLGDSHTPALLDTGEPITAGHARKLACEAGIIPLVLGGKSKILDLGRKKRLYDLYQRIAIRHRDKQCTTLGCDWPAALCHVHHNTPWARGGKTNIADGRLLCPATTPTPLTQVRDEDRQERTRRLQPDVSRLARDPPNVRALRVLAGERKVGRIDVTHTSRMESTMKRIRYAIAGLGLLFAVVLLPAPPASATIHEIVAAWCSGHGELEPPGIQGGKNFAQPVNSNGFVGPTVRSQDRPAQGC